FPVHNRVVDKRRSITSSPSHKEYFSLLSGRKLFVRMYNCLKMSGDLKMKILSLDLSGNKNASSMEVPENKENASPQPETSSDSGDVPPTPDLSSNTSTTDSDMVTKIINRPVSFVDTKNVSIEVKRWLEISQVCEEWFATKLLKRWRSTLTDAINNPKDWNDGIRNNNNMYARIHNWMSMTEEQRQEILRLLNAPITDTSQTDLSLGGILEELPKS
ncbi:hypothetical protein CRE_01509, partial [Caenorhabditis remanei]